MNHLLEWLTNICFVTVSIFCLLCSSQRRVTDQTFLRMKVFWGEKCKNKNKKLRLETLKPVLSVASCEESSLLVGIPILYILCFLFFTQTLIWSILKFIFFHAQVTSSDFKPVNYTAGYYQVYDPRSYFQLNPGYSPTGRYIQIQPIYDTLSVGDTQEIRVLYTSDDSSVSSRFKFQVNFCLFLFCPAY